MNAHATHLRDLFKQMFLPDKENPETAMLRQDNKWQEWLEKDPNPEQSLLDLRRGAEMRSADFVARSFAVLLAPRGDLVPFFVPPKVALLGERPLHELEHLFASPKTRLSALTFATQVLVSGYRAAEEGEYLSEALVERYALLLPKALRFLSLGNSLANQVLDCHERNEALREHSLAH